MLVSVDRAAPDPVYMQLVTSIANQISNGSLSPNTRLPPARDLGDALGINMHTVLKAYRILETEGMVKMRRGRGGVIVAPRPSLDGLVAQFVSTARLAGMSQTEVLRMVKETW